MPIAIFKRVLFFKSRNNISNLLKYYSFEKFRNDNNRAFLAYKLIKSLNLMAWRLEISIFS